MKNTNLIASLTLVGACAGFANAAYDTVDVAGVSFGAGQSVNFTLGGNAESAWAGNFNIALTNSSGVNLDGSWVTFCTEISQNINLPSSPIQYDVMPVSALPTPGTAMGVASADAIARMYAFAAGSQYGANADLASAFQIAIWEIYNDYSTFGIDLSTGNFQGTFSAGIDGYLTGLFAAANNLNGPMATITGLGNASYQDLIIETPAPGALALMGVAGLLGSRRRKA